jgi:hypothetical protein
MPISNWSTVAADNDDSDLASGINLAEGQAPGSLNDSIRSIMAVLAAANASDTAKGFVELATSAETLTGTDTTRAVTPAALGANQLFATNGYKQFPGGLILQWGVVASTGADGFVTFPMAFPTQAFGVFPVMTPGALAATQSVTVFTGGLGPTGFSYYPRFMNNGGGVGTAAQGFYWLAVGR